ncbi:sigma-E factor negative regulatory protein [Hydrogenophaga sp. RWCD_12]|uniref:sigma-E factor negative regulatory protein n=1 Tax=Hydrogenophaga sp. RWCD_12 TaxID=3391190 RepID=UPI003984DE53
MNAEMRKPFSDSQSPGLEDRRAMAVSALVDGELSMAELDELLRDEGTAVLHAEWTAYHLIGDVLRSGGVGLAARSGDDLASMISRRLRDEKLEPGPQAGAVVHVRGPAANASVFRWKLVAGIASVTAVAAVGWALTGLVGGPANTGGQLALISPQNAPVAVQEVVVQTPQGPMSRDPRLEQLLAEHRQYGGMSALQTPTGFLRNATYDTAPQR